MPVMKRVFVLLQKTILGYENTCSMVHQCSDLSEKVSSSTEHFKEGALPKVDAVFRHCKMWVSRRTQKPVQLVYDLSSAQWDCH